MANAGLSSTLSHNSWSKADWYGFLACISFAMLVMLIQFSAFHILWQTRFYERITKGTWTRYVVLPAHWMALGMLINHACIATGLFFLLYNFQHETGVVGGVQVHHPGNFSWVVGWLVASIFASWFVPMLVHSFSNLVTPAIFEVASFVGLLMAFGYEINYIRQDTAPQLSTSSPAMWLLIYPVVAKFYMSLITIRAAYVSMTDADYLQLAEIDRGTVSNDMTTYNQSFPTTRGDADVALARAALQPDYEEPRPPVPAPATLFPASALPEATTERRHARQPTSGAPAVPRSKSGREK